MHVLTDRFLQFCGQWRKNGNGSKKRSILFNISFREYLRKGIEIDLVREINMDPVAGKDIGRVTYIFSALLVYIM